MESALNITDNEPNNITNPWIDSFIVSAPGKAIIFGEHAVVHFQPAIAASISLRTYVLVRSNHETSPIVRLYFPDIKFSLSWNSVNLPWKEFGRLQENIESLKPTNTLNVQHLKLIQPFIVNALKNATEICIKTFTSAATAFLLLFMYLGKPYCSNTFIIRSSLPVASGLGSSASLSVSLACALLILNGQISPPKSSSPSDESTAHSNLINAWAYISEMCYHGNPSGIDNTVVCFGKAVYFKRNAETGSSNIRWMANFPRLPFIITNTRQQRSTADLVRRVTLLKETFPAIVDKLFEAIGDVTEKAYLLLTQHAGPVNTSLIHSLGKLMVINHGLLVSLGVSHPRIERVRAAIDFCDKGWSKLTGAGGGGCVISLIRQEMYPVPDRPAEMNHEAEGESELMLTALKSCNPFTESQLARIMLDLMKESLEPQEVMVGVAGVGILTPNCSEESGRIKSIDHELFVQCTDISCLYEPKGIEKIDLNTSEWSWKHWQRESYAEV